MPIGDQNVRCGDSNLHDHWPPT